MRREINTQLMELYGKDAIQENVNTKEAMWWES